MSRQLFATIEKLSVKIIKMCEFTCQRNMTRVFYEEELINYLFYRLQELFELRAVLRIAFVFFVVFCRPFVRAFKSYKHNMYRTRANLTPA